MRRLFASVLICAAPMPAYAAELVMFESASCPWCDRWNEELAEVYPVTPEGKRAPLRRHDIADKRPDDLKGVRPIRYTPTFVLVENGAEVGRVTGYQSEDFFWGLLGEIIEDLPSVTE